MKNTRAVIFDMDGVVIDSQAIADLLLQKTCLKHGASLSKEDLRKLTGTSSKSFWGYVKKKFSLPESVSYYIDEYDVDLEIKEYDTLSPDKFLLKLLDKLKSEEFKIALATSASKKRMQAVIDKFNLLEYFLVTLCAEDVSNHKPDPEIYLSTAEKLNALPKKCIVVEDSELGVQAAKNAGMKCIGFTGFTKNQQDLSLADLVINDYSEIDLQKINGL